MAEDGDRRGSQINRASSPGGKMTQTLHSKVWQFSCLTTCRRFLFSSLLSLLCSQPGLGSILWDLWLTDALVYLRWRPSTAYLALSCMSLPGCQIEQTNKQQAAQTNLNSRQITKQKKKLVLSQSPMSHAICQCMSRNILHILTLKMMDCLSGI